MADEKPTPSVKFTAQDYTPEDYARARAFAGSLERADVNSSYVHGHLAALIATVRREERMGHPPPIECTSVDAYGVVCECCERRITQMSTDHGVRYVPEQPTSNPQDEFPLVEFPRYIRHAILMKHGSNGDYEMVADESFDAGVQEERRRVYLAGIEVHRTANVSPRTPALFGDDDLPCAKCQEVTCECPPAKEKDK